MVKMVKIEAILGAARTRTMRRTKDNLEKDRQLPEKMSIFGKSFIISIQHSMLRANLKKVNTCQLLLLQHQSTYPIGPLVQNLHQLKPPLLDLTS